MDVPIAFRLDSEVEAYRLDGVDLSSLAKHAVGRPSNGPSIVISRRAAIIPEMNAGLLNTSDIVAFYEGSGGAILVVVPEVKSGIVATPVSQQHGDQSFVTSVKRSVPALFDLASKTIEAIRAEGVRGDLVEVTGGRWVNRPVNTFTLKVQPRAGNIQFTLYGNPDTYQHKEFLLADQNSYSRGWVRNKEDAGTLAKFAKESQLRRAK